MQIMKVIDQPWNVKEVTCKCDCGRTSTYGIRQSNAENVRCTNPDCSVVFNIDELKAASA